MDVSTPKPFELAFANSIYWVMVETSLPENIGAAARAIKTMGFGNLVLVNPKNFPHPQAVAMSAGASDVLEQAIVVDTLEQALANCHLVLATSSRKRSVSWPLVDVRGAASMVYQQFSERTLPLNTPTASYNTAILFGREDRGLTNQELAFSHYHVYIPSDDNYGILNIAAAMQILAYEMRCASLYSAYNPADATNLSADQPDRYLAPEPWVSTTQMEQFYAQLTAMLVSIEFLDPTNPRHMDIKLKRLFNRIRLNTTEYNLLRGIWAKTISLAQQAKASKN